jgi:cytochrome c oxidase assembly protein subunit 15
MSTVNATLGTSRAEGRSTVQPVADSYGDVRLWLWSAAAIVFLLVIVGGATRLTESGLSITQWQPISGILPPLNDAAWQAEFAGYKQIPQFAKMFPTMDLGEFKHIFYWEWTHRLLARLIGVVFAVPLAWFWIRGRLTGAMKVKFLGVLALGGLQGVVGWWIVSSGLEDRVEVAPERLAIHLLLASITFVALIWLAVGLKPAKPEKVPGRLAWVSGLMMLLILVQLGLGSLVAGLRAGYSNNTWPLIDGGIIPPLDQLGKLSPFWSNFFDNVLTVQFDHRMVAYLIFAVALWHMIDARRSAPGTHAARRATALFGLVLCQVALGITTLLVLAIPLTTGPLLSALTHQAFAMIVLAMATVHRRRLSAL